MDLNDKNTAANNFIIDLTANVRANLNNDQFGNETLARKYVLSRTQFWRNKKTTGKSGGQFIKQIRHNQAPKIVHSSDAKITDVIFQEGFHGASYFASCFKKHYVLNPLKAKFTFNANEKSLTSQTNEDSALVYENKVNTNTDHNWYALYRKAEI